MAMGESSNVASKGHPLQKGNTELRPERHKYKAKKEAKPEANVMDVDYADNKALL